MSKRIRGAAVIAAAIVLASAGPILLPGCGGREKAAPAGAPAQVVTGVEIATVSPAVQERIVDAVGTVRSRTIAAVAPQIMGRVTSFPVSEGSRVERGAVLATIDDAAARAQASAADGAVAEAVAAGEEAERAIAQAEAGKSLAERTYARFAKLHDERVVTRQEFEEVEARRTVALKDYERALERRSQAAGRLAQARGRADEARAMLSHAKVTAPFQGVVTEKKGEAGSMAVPGVPLLVMEDSRTFRIEAAIPETHLSRLPLGLKVQVVLDASPDMPIQAVISEVVPMVDPLSRTFIAKADIAGQGLRSGMSGRLRFSAGKETVLAVPRKAVFNAGGFDGAFVIGADNVARLAMVKTGRTMGDTVEILAGIDPGSRVAVSQVDRLADGARVEVRR